MRYVRYDNYWNAVGINYRQMVRLKGEPFSTVQEDNAVWYYYKDAVYRYDSRLRRMSLVSLQDDKVRFGVFRIGVNTPRPVVEAVYFLKKRRVEINDENKFCVKDGLISTITYCFDNNNRVKTIHISFYDF